MSSVNSLNYTKLIVIVLFSSDSLLAVEIETFMNNLFMVWHSRMVSQQFESQKVGFPMQLICSLDFSIFTDDRFGFDFNYSNYTNYCLYYWYFSLVNGHGSQNIFPTLPIG